MSPRLKNNTVAIHRLDRYTVVLLVLKGKAMHGIYNL
jgi:hypothetical protein